MDLQDSEAASAARLNPAVVVLLLALTFVWGARVLLAKDSPAQPDPTDTLVLVRDWDATSGLMVGWLPAHNAAIQLELIEKSAAPHFEPDEAVYIAWPRRQNLKPQKAQLLVAPSPRTFEGKAWVPVSRDPNIVLIGKKMYLVRGFVLGESRWREPVKKWTTPVSATRSSASQ